jgi:hypothetical protein
MFSNSDGPAEAVANGQLLDRDTHLGSPRSSATSLAPTIPSRHAGIGWL